MSLVIGLTGGIASGKSTVSNMLKKLGAVIIDADIEARLAVEPEELAYKKIIEFFGDTVLNEDKSLDRGKLGSIIFHDPEKRKVLNEIVHPAVRERMLQKKDKAINDHKEIIVLDIPLLFESKLAYMAEKTLLVYVTEEVQLSRLISRNGFTEEDALARIKSQMPLKDKIPLADAVINNNGDLSDTESQLIKIVNQWQGKPLTS
ncbi:dephospho-CoA kinase [Mesobacillus harenae]|uniref:dephospho-CoA kinase n=1 Tax=Mesobacillus harenae TaxID=2213203 RepID=UPI0015809181|nr:dephospho-CoA kinase [Mesobacillus harenae]